MYWAFIFRTGEYAMWGKGGGQIQQGEGAKDCNKTNPWEQCNILRLDGSQEER
jgi:hypothetical protein